MIGYGKYLAHSLKTKNIANRDGWAVYWIVAGKTK
jgi:hypothetical protein